MSNTIDFSKNGGYRLKQFTLRKMQEDYKQSLAAFIAFCGIPATGSFIISGMQLQSGNITEGYCYIDGELCFFEASPGTSNTKIKKNIVIQSLGFQNGNNENVFRFVNAQVDLIDGQPYSSFTRISPVFDSLYLRFSQAEKDKLANIQAGAEVNVQPDWNVENPLLDSFIRNKPSIISPLKIGTFAGISDVNGNASYVIPFGLNIGTNEYIVFGQFYTPTTNNGFQHNNLIWATRNHLATSFEILIHEAAGTSQNVHFNYMIIPNN